MDSGFSIIPSLANFPIPAGYPDHESYYFYNPNDQEVYDAYDLFRFFNIYFFHNILEASEVKWSSRMTLCAGTCQLQSPGSCLITLSKPLLQFRTNNELKETLVHEMIHGYLFITNPKACRDRGGHGTEFCEIMNNINAMTGLNISVYHSFHDEVDYFRKHVWKCNGPCQHQKPFYGLVKRAMNRAPGPTDYWWKQHQEKCGGQYIKIEGPEFNQEGKNKDQDKDKDKKQPNKKRKPTVPSNDLNKYLKKTKSSSEYDLIPRVHFYLIPDDEDEPNSMNTVIERPKEEKKASNNEKRKEEDMDKKLDFFAFKKEKKTGTLFDYMKKVPSASHDQIIEIESNSNSNSMGFSFETPEKFKNNEWSMPLPSTNMPFPSEKTHKISPIQEEKASETKFNLPSSGKSSTQSKSLENKVVYSIFIKKENCKNNERFWLRLLINSEQSLESLLNIIDLICLSNADKNGRLIFLGDKQIVFFNKSLADLDISEGAHMEDITNGVQFKLEKKFFLAEVKNVNIMKAKHFPVCIGASFFKADGTPEPDLQERIENINEMLISIF